MTRNSRWLFLLVFLGVSTTKAITYDEALKIAFANSPGLSVTDLGIAESGEQLAQTRASFSPSVSFKGSYTRLGAVPVTKIAGYEFTMGSADNYSAGFSVTVPLFLGGKRAWGEEMARLGVESAEEQSVLARSDLHSQVTAAFYGLLLAEEAEKISAANLKDAVDKHAETEARWKVGYASALDLKQDEVAVSQAKASLISAQNSTLKAQQFLNMVLGEPVSKPQNAEGSLEMTYEEMGVDSLVLRALERRPEITALSRAERIARLSRSVARSSYTPSLAFVTQPTWQNPYESEDAWGSSISATVALEWPLYDGGKGLSQVREADIQLKKIEYSKTQAEEGIELDVRQAYASWVEASQQLLVQQTLGAQMAELSRMADEQYNTGVISSLDYQTIQLAKTQAELARLAALYQMIIAREKLRTSAWLWDQETLKEFKTSSVSDTNEESK
jgi:outer membrane protein